MATRAQAPREEAANAASHGVGLVAAVAALPLLVAADAPFAVRMDAGTAVFLATLLLLYLASSTYHALPVGPAKQRWKRIDHAAIFVFIAGSWTPFALRGGVDGALVALVWTLAATGAALKLLGRLPQRAVSTALYFAFGWLALIALGPLAGLPALRGAVAWLIAGGIAYSVGTVFFLLDERLRYGHLVWHLFVLSGSACHFAAVLHDAG